MKYLLLLILLTGSLFSFSQQHEIIKTKLNTKVFEFPYKGNLTNPIYSLNPYNIIEQFYNTSNELVFEKKPKFKTSFYILNLGKKSTEIHTVYILLYENEENVFISFDTNQNRSFCDEELIHIKYDSPYFIDLSFGEIYREFEYKVNSHATFESIGKMSIRSLNYLELRCLINEKLLKIAFSSSFIGTYFKIKTKNYSNNEISTQVFTLNEPFEFNGKTVVVSNFDPILCLAEITILPNSTITYGYREGYYTNKIFLEKKIKKKLVKKYSLMYFWGIWCAPCVANIEKTKAIEAMVKNRSNIEMLYFPTIFKALDKKKTEKFIIKHNLPVEQYFEVLQNTECNKVIPFFDDCSITNLLKINSFPTYILLDNEGRIIYRGSNENNEIIKLIETL